MTLHICEHQSVPAGEIVAILPILARADGVRSGILLADGRMVETTVLAATLKRRLDALTPPQASFFAK